MGWVCRHADPWDCGPAIRLPYSVSAKAHAEFRRGDCSAQLSEILDKIGVFRQTRASILSVIYLSVPVSQGTSATFECLDRRCLDCAVPLVVTPRRPPATPSTALATSRAFAGKAMWPRRRSARPT